MYLKCRLQGVGYVLSTYFAIGHLVQQIEGVAILSNDRITGVTKLILVHTCLLTATY